MSGTKGPDDDVVGQKRARDDGRQTAEQKAVLGGGGETGGVEEDRSGWGRAGPGGGEPGRAPVSLGGSSQGQSDRMPAGGTVADERATNPKTRPGERHEA